MTKMKYRGRSYRQNSKPQPDEALQAKTRKCLMCNAVFQSGHFGERVCQVCKRTSDWNSSNATVHHENLRGLK